MSAIYDYLGLQSETELNLRLTKERVLQQVKIQTQKKKLSNELNNIDDIIWKYSLKEEQCGVLTELQIIEIHVKEPKYCKPIMDVIIETIPYSLLIVFVSAEKYLFAYSGEDLEWNWNAKYICSDWIYGEEISGDFQSYLADEYTLSEIEQQEAMSAVLVQFVKLYHRYQNLEYMCLRRYIDLLKIREHVLDKELVFPVITESYNAGDLICSDDCVCIIYIGDAERAFQLVDNSKYGIHSLIDARFGIDRCFEELAEKEFTTTSEAYMIYQKVEINSLESMIDFDNDE